MRISTALLVCLFASVLNAAPVTFVGAASFTGGLNGSWSFQYLSGAPDLYIQQIRIDLSPTDLRFDAAPGGFGSLSYQDIGNFGGSDAASGLTAVSATGAALDGGKQVTFTFDSFTPGMTFGFNADVDHPDPTLLALQDCTGKKGLELAGCVSGNFIRTSANDALLLGAQTVGPNAMAGALVTFQLGGPNYQTTSVTASFESVTLRDVVGRLLDGDGPNSFSSNGNGIVDADPIPEPATMAILGFGLGGLMLFSSRLRRWRNRQ